MVEFDPDDLFEDEEDRFDPAEFQMPDSKKPKHRAKRKATQSMSTTASLDKWAVDQ